LKQACVLILVVTLATCRDWSSLEDEALTCLAGCGRDAGGSVGGGANGGGSGGNAAGGGTEDGGSCTPWVGGGGADTTCSLSYSKPSGGQIWSRTFSSQGAAASRIAIASTGCLIDVLTAFDAAGALRVLELDGGDRCSGATTLAEIPFVIDLAARDGTIAAVWPGGGGGALQTFDRNGAPARYFPIPFTPSRVQIGKGGDDVFTAGVDSSGIRTQRMVPSTGHQASGPSWGCLEIQISSLLALDPGSYLLCGKAGVAYCNVNVDLSPGSGFLTPVDDAGVAVGSAFNLHAAFGSGGLYSAFNYDFGDGLAGVLRLDDLNPTFPGMSHEPMTWDGTDGGLAAPASVVVDPLQPVAYVVIATDAALTLSASSVNTYHSVPGVGAVVVKLVSTTTTPAVAWAVSIGGSGELPSGALLVGNQLLVAGTCEGNTSTLCPDPHATWIVSLAP
jgi:hypothetical protein